MKTLALVLNKPIGAFEGFLVVYWRTACHDGMFTGRFAEGPGCQGSRTVLNASALDSNLTASGALDHLCFGRLQQAPNPKSCKSTCWASGKQEALHLRQARSSSNLDKYIDAQAVRRGLKAGCKQWGGVAEYDP